jgi:hypothetical protein
MGPSVTSPIAQTPGAEVFQWSVSMKPRLSA